MPSILESLNKELGQGRTLVKLGRLMDGDADQASEGIATAGPALLGALAENAGTDEGAEPVADLVESIGPSILDDVNGYLDRGDTRVGTGVLDALFGDDRRELLAGLSSTGSVSSSGYSKLLPILTPLVLGAVARRKAEDDLDARGLAMVLADERRSLEDDGNLGEWFGRTLAGGGAIAAIGGVAAMARGRIGAVSGSIGDAAEDAVKAGGDATEGVADKVGDLVGALRGRGDDDGDGVGGDAGDRDKRPGWLWWAAGAVILALLLAWLLSRGGDDEVVDDAMGVTATTATATDADADGATDADADSDGATGGDTGSDAAITAAVEAAVADAGLADTVSVSVSDGVVTLTGTAGPDADLDALVAAVEGVEGVSDVVNEITVAGDAGSDEAASADAELLAAVVAAVAEAGFGDSVTVSVSGGVVTLAGTVGSAADVEAVGAAASGVEGVGEVVNDVTVAGGDDSGSAPAAGASLNEQLGLAPITFDYRSARVTAQSESVLAEVVAYLEANEGSIVIEGHTDNDGTNAENLALGQRRADAVVAFLEAAGIDGARLEAVGIGESEPKVPNDSADAKAANRRIELIVAG